MAYKIVLREQDGHTSAQILDSDGKQVMHATKVEIAATPNHMEARVTIPVKEVFAVSDNGELEHQEF
jgi:hypothetical protein